MHDFERAALMIFGVVRILECLENSNCDVHRQIDGNPAGIPASAHQALERLPRKVLHRNATLPIKDSNLKGLNDVFMFKTTNKPRLIHEHLKNGRIIAEVGV
jgi:hypothetical protein